jgi:hypothetical protein
MMMNEEHSSRIRSNDDDDVVVSGEHDVTAVAKRPATLLRTDTPVAGGMYARSTPTLPGLLHAFYGAPREIALPIHRVADRLVILICIHPIRPSNYSIVS